MTYRIMLLVELTKLSDMSDNLVVITPQRRFTRAPQGSPQVFRRP